MVENAIQPIKEKKNTINKVSFLHELILSSVISRFSTTCTSVISPLQYDIFLYKI